MKVEKKYSIVVVLILMLTTIFLKVSVENVLATNLEQLGDALKQEEALKEELEQQLNEAEGEHSNLSTQKDKLEYELNRLNQELEFAGQTLEVLELEKKIVEEKIIIIQNNLKIAKETEEWQFYCMQKRIQFMYESGDNLFLETLFSMKSLTSFLNFSTYMEEVAEYDQRLLSEYQATKEFIESEDIRLVGEKIKLEELVVEAEEEQKRISNIVATTSSTVQQYKAEMGSVEQEMLEYELELKQKEEDIAALKKQIELEIALSQAAANAEWRDISDVQFEENDRYLLANLIYCEAGGEPYVGQVAVGAVVINRLLSSKYPDTLTGVIYQKSQFSPVASGRLALALAENRATDNCYKAADEAMAGVTNVGNCLYFRTPIDGLVGISIGGHIFY